MKNLIKTNSTQPSFNLKSIVKNISSYNKRKQEEKESHNLKSKHNRRKMKTNLNTKKLEEERRINDLQRMKDKLENKQDEWINDKYYFEKSNLIHINVLNSLIIKPREFDSFFIYKEY